MKQHYASKNSFKRAKKNDLFLIPNNISIKEELSKTMYAIANFADDKEIEKEYDNINEDEDYVAININKDIKRKSN